MREFQNQSIEVRRPTLEAQRDPESHTEEKKS